MKDEIKISKKTIKKHFNFSFLRLLIFLIVIIPTITCGTLFKKDIELVFNGEPTVVETQTKVDYNGLVVHYIDVGQGDCIAIEFPTGEKMLIDAGPVSGRDNMLKYLDEKVFDLPSEEKVFDIVLLTHSDADHCGGMPEIFEQYEVKKAYRPQIYIDETDKIADANIGVKTKLVTTQIYTKTITAMKNEVGCEMIYTNLNIVNTTKKIVGGSGNKSFNFKFYSPIGNYYSDVNNYSPIMALNYGGKVFMFTGDAEKKNEEELLNSINNGTVILPKVDVLKVGHHGSDTSSNPELINKMNPKIAVIQVGKDNKYGHPKQKTLDILNNLGCKIYRNDLDSNVVINVSSNNNLFILNDPNVSEQEIYANEFYIHVEYLETLIVVIAFVFCFLIKYKVFDENL